MSHPIMSNCIFVNDLMSISSPPQGKTHYARTPNTNDSLSSNKENTSTASKKLRRFKDSAGRLSRPPLTQKRRFGLRVRKTVVERSTEPVIKSIDFFKRLTEEGFNYGFGIDDTKGLLLSPPESKLRSLPR